MEILIVAVLLIGFGLGFWMYQCQKKVDCSITGQSQIILKHLEQGRTLTVEQAKTIYGIKHLRSVISRLRHNYDIDIETAGEGRKAVYKKK